MNMTNEEYNEYIKKKQPRSPLGMDMLRAFLVGGLICAGGEGLRTLYISLGLDTESAGTAVSISLVFSARCSQGWGCTTISRALPGPARSCRSRALPTPLSPPPSTLKARIDL